MGMITKAAEKAGDAIAKAAALSPEQVAEIQARRENYFDELKTHDLNSAAAVEFTQGLLAASSVEIFNAHLSQIKQLYKPVVKNYGLNQDFSAEHNIRFLSIGKWVSDKEENTLEKLINVYDVLSDEDCNIALVFHRTKVHTEVYLAVTNNKNDERNSAADSLIQRLGGAVKGNFPGAELKGGKGKLPFLNGEYRNYSVASASNIPTEKSEKFSSQTIEKLLDGIVPQNSEEEYTLILLATPVQDVEAKKIRLAELYSGMSPYASWQTNFTYTESDAVSSGSQFGVNVGASAGLQNGVNQSITNSLGAQQSASTSENNSSGTTITDAEGNTVTDTNSNTLTKGSSQSASRAVSEGTNTSSTNTYGSSQSRSVTEGNSKSIGGGSTTTGTIGSTTTVGASSTTTVGVSSATTAGVSGNVGVGIAGGSVSASQTFETSASEAVSVSASESVSASVSEALNVNYNNTSSNSTTDLTGTSSSFSNMTGQSFGLTNTTSTGISQSTAQTVGRAIGQAAQHSLATSTVQAIANTLGRAVTKTTGLTLGEFKGANLGVNFGMNFARSSNVTATVGKNESITQSFTNYNIRHTLEILETQMKRYEQSAALGMWDFAAYVLSEDFNTVSNVAHLYVALTQGEESFMSKAAINVWRGDMGNEKEESVDAKEICGYLRDLRHPIFALNPQVTDEQRDYNIYPPIIKATACLSGKELAYSLNFPKKSVAGLPVIECAEFGRNIVTYSDTDQTQKELCLGQIFHMNHKENTAVCLAKNALASHTFITGSTGSGKSNTVYHILNNAGVNFLVVEPAKGEYKNVFGNPENVKVYGTNPLITPLLRINPFSFPKEIHIFEHLDRLIEIFNVCWPMYAAMPAVLKNALEKSYEDCGWNLVDSTNEFGDDLYPNFADVARNVKLIIDTSEYDNENKGAYKGSLLTRLRSLTNGIYGLIFSADEIPAKELFDSNVIADLSRVGSAETKSLIMGMLVLKLQEYRMTSSGMNNELKHLTVLEEAHNLLKRTLVEQPVEGSNLLGKSVEMIANAIAEMRSYGEGFIIVDQAPGLLDMSTIRNTNTKVIMRLPDQTDRELVGKAANLNDNQIAELAKLPCGVGAVYQNEWVQPVLCKVDEFKYTSQPYKFERFVPDPAAEDPRTRLEIAELLSNGSVIGKEALLNDIMPKLRRLKLDASIQASILKILVNPYKEPRMTKLAPIMSALFPNVYKAVESSYNESHEAHEWTISAENSLRSSLQMKINDQIRRDIVQAIITDHIYNQLGRTKDLELWSKEGGLQ